MADEMIGERDAFEAWWRDWQRGTWDASIDREMPAHWNEDSRSRMKLAYQAGRASLAASAGADCERCSGSGEDPEGFYDQSRGDAGHTHEGPCRSCGGSGVAASAGSEPVAQLAAERDELFQAAIDFIRTLTGMEPPPIEVAPPEVFAPFREFVNTVQAITDKRHPSPPEGMAGWKLVPIEPTLDMGWAYLDAARESEPLRTHSFNHAGYRAMIAAAPPLPASEAKEL